MTDIGKHKSRLPEKSADPVRLSEFELIEHFFAPLAGEGGFGLQDDIAALPPLSDSDEERIVSTDALIADVHFFAGDAPSSIARKALAVNVSDLVAKGAQPEGFFLSLALPDSCSSLWLKEFVKGLRQGISDWKCPLFGGDTVYSPRTLMISVTAFGKLPRGKIPKRSDAKSGDNIFVTGTIGDSFLGLNLIKAEKSDSNHLLWSYSLSRSEKKYLKDRYYHPAPRMALIPVIQSFAHASMDISDGLVGDFLKMAKASGLGAKLDIELNILSPAARSAVIADYTLFDALIRGGDDYEILFTVSQDNTWKCRQTARELGISLTHIGIMQSCEDAVEIRHNGHLLTLQHASFQHF